MKRILKFIVIPIVVTFIVAIILYYFISARVISEAREHIENAMLTNRGLHHYIQRDMLPVFFADRSTGYIKQDYYNPVIFSSSYIVRVMHRYFNEERKKSGMPKVYYKLAADNPRNPVNRADAYESALLRKFNENRTLKAHEEIVTINDRRFMHYSIPFLETNTACLRCHGRREDAPSGLQKLYPGQGGFGDRVGNIRAIESIRVPIGDQIRNAVIFTGSATSGFIALMILFLFNSMMRTTVREQTIHLENSLREKDVLLKEVHHRVKNNMAIISSFLELQSMNCSDEKTEKLLFESIRRIKSMAIIHEKLYRNTSVASIPVDEYLRELLNDITASYGLTDTVLQLEADSISMSLDRLILVGLLVNEITMNSFKYGFTSISDPKITVKMHRDNDNIMLFISDNGPGIGENRRPGF